MAKCSFTIMIVFCAMFAVLISIVMLGCMEHINFNTLYGSALDLVLIEDLKFHVLLVHLVHNPLELAAPTSQTKINYKVKVHGHIPVFRLSYVEQTHQHFEDGFTQRNKRRNHHHNTSFRERCTGPVKLHINRERECLESRWTCSGTCHSRSVRYPDKHQRTDTSTPPAACLSRLDLVFQHRITRTREQKRR